MALISGVERLTVEAHADARGVLHEMWRRSVQLLEVRQVLVTRSTPGSLRGMHYHLRQADLCYVAEGRVFMALVDLRKSTIVKDELWIDDRETLLIPAGVAHGYATLEGATVVYLLTEEVDGTDEFGFRWNDLDAGIEWPVETPTLSGRDRSAGPLAAAMAHARAAMASRDVVR